MRPAQTPILAGSLIAVTALLVGFQSVSTLLTVTQLGASQPIGSPPKSHASLVPQPPIPAIKPSEPVSMPAPRASEPTPEEPAAPAAGVTADARPMPSVPDNQVGAAAVAKAQAQAEMDAMGDQVEQNSPPERRRRHRAPRPELHKVY